jgi:SAM-dependent methyltransferase
MNAEPLRRVLEATGYISDGEPAPGVRLGADAQNLRRGRHFTPDALWRGATATTVYFKYQDAPPDKVTVSTWHREIWNEGFAPLLWVISPDAIQLYNGFSRPTSKDDASRHLLQTFQAIEQQLIELDHLAGRLAMETGQFWLRSNKVNRKTSVDEQLLSDLAALELDLVEVGMERGAAQGLIGRSIFTQYLVDREIINSTRLQQECGSDHLSRALRDPQAAERLFSWLADVFNGDMFPSTTITGPIEPDYLTRVADFLEAVDPQTRQTTFFPYQFDVIPVELISSIYEQFAHSKVGVLPEGEEEFSGADTPGQAKRRGVHYTRLPVVSLILDEVMNTATGEESVLDLTCGSGVFLVEALRRLVEKKGGATPPRGLIRSTLYHQIFGVDISEAAVRVAAFSLYLAALELDPDPQPPEALKFEKLIGRSLLIGNARDIETKPEGAPLLDQNGKPRTFDVIVGNPPWTFRGKAGTDERRIAQQPGRPRQPRGEGLDFVLRATDFGHGKTRYGIVLSAMPFFAGSKTGALAARYVIEQLAPATLVNLAPLTKWLFPTAKMPAVVLLARHRLQDPALLTVVNVPWSPSTEKSYTFEIAPSDVTVLPLAEWSADPQRLKTAVFGRSRDMALLDQLRANFLSLGDWLRSVGSEWRDGLILGKPARRTRPANHLIGLPLLETKDLSAFRVPDDLVRFSEPMAQWPRARETYKAPILLIKEFLKASPRPVTAVTEEDLVYTDAYFGAALPRNQLESARLISAILGSALASWFFLMTAAEFGIWKRRLLTSDVGLLPLPNPNECLRSEPGQRIMSLESIFRSDAPNQHGLNALDDAVFGLYGIDEIDQVIIRDGLIRAGWQWSEGRDAASSPAAIHGDLDSYAETFMTGLDVWLQAANARHLRAEIFDLPMSSPLRVVRFIIGKGRREPVVDKIAPNGSLADVLDGIGRRLQTRLGSALVGERELRVHGENEVVIIKPAARRFWMRSVALEDADAVVAESFSGAAA